MAKDCTSPFSHSGFPEADGVVNTETGDIRCSKCGTITRKGWPRAIRTVEGKVVLEEIKDAMNVTIYHGPEGYRFLDGWTLKTALAKLEGLKPTLPTSGYESYPWKKYAIQRHFHDLGKCEGLCGYPAHTHKSTGG